MNILHSFRRLGLRGKLLTTFLIAACVTLVVSLIGLIAIRSLNRSVTEIGHQRLVALEQMLTTSAQVDELTTHLQSATRNSISFKERAEQRAAFLQARADYRKALDQAELVMDAEGQEMLLKLRAETKQWAAVNDRIWQSLETIDKAKIDAPLPLVRDLEGFRGDHLRLVAEAYKHLRDGSAYNGGTDDTTCRFGRWHSAFRSENAEIQSVMERTQDPHHRFHAGIRDFQEKLAAGQRDQAAQILESTICPAADETLQVIRISYTSRSRFSRHLKPHGKSWTRNRSP